MRAGEFPDGARVLRAKIDMASPNINLRDPVLYRIVHAAHPRTGDAWCIYPTYDFAHGQSDAIEGVTHSICTLEFEDHRPLYDWLIEHLPVPSRPRQYEFARLNLTYTVLSKRFLLRLVDEGRVRGWDDPRMPTISGLRRRGFPAEGIRDFAAMIGVAKARQRHRDRPARARGARTSSTARRRGASACCDPLKVVIENYPDGQVEERGGRRTTRRTRPPGRGRSRSGASCGSSATTSWRSRRRSSSGSRRAARCASGRRTSSPAGRSSRTRRPRYVELRCTYDPATRGGDAPDGRRPKATLHWVSARARRPGRGPPLRPPLHATRPGRRAATCSPTSTRAPRPC